MRIIIDNQIPDMMTRTWTKRPRPGPAGRFISPATTRVATASAVMRTKGVRPATTGSWSGCRPRTARAPKKITSDSPPRTAASIRHVNLPCGRAWSSEVTRDRVSAPRCCGSIVLTEVEGLDGRLPHRLLHLGQAEQEAHLADGDDGAGGDDAPGDAPFVGQLGRVVEGIGQLVDDRDAVVAEDVGGDLPEAGRAHRPWRRAPGDDDLVERGIERLEDPDDVLVREDRDDTDG